MEFSEAERRYRRLSKRYAAGSLSAQDFDRMVQRLLVVDPAGCAWRIGTLTGRWYRHQGERWQPVSFPGEATLAMVASAIPAAPPHRLPAPLPKSLRTLMPLFISLGCILLIYLSLVLVALFDRRLEALTLSLLRRGTPLAAAADETLTATPSLTPTLIATATLTPTITLTPTPLPPLMRRAPGGPWLLIASGDGLWVTAADGLARTHLSPRKVLAPLDLAQAVSPRGGMIAFITAVKDDPPSDLLLTVMQLPEGKTLATIPITPPVIGVDGASRSADSLAAVLERNSLAWSPDGQYLAFIGLQDGQSADLYLYSVASGAVKRLHSHISQAVDPLWSPDSRYIIFFGANRFEKGSGLDEMAGVWVARPGGEAAVSLYQPTSSREIAAGWISPSRLALYSWNAVCQGYRLRFVDVAARKSESVFAGCFNSVAVEAGSGNVIFAVGEALAGFCSCAQTVGEGAGIFYLPVGMGLPRLIDQRIVDRVSWHAEAGIFFAAVDGMWQFAFDPSGKPVNLPVAGMQSLPSVSRLSGNWAWTGWQPGAGQGLWVSVAGQPPRRIAGESATLPQWAPDGQTLIYFDAGTMMLAQSPRFQPVTLEGFDAGVNQAVWVTQ